MNISLKKLSKNEKRSYICIPQTEKNITILTVKVP